MTNLTQSNPFRRGPTTRISFSFTARIAQCRLGTTYFRPGSGHIRSGSRHFRCVWRHFRCGQLMARDSPPQRRRWLAAVAFVALSAFAAELPLSLSQKSKRCWAALLSWDAHISPNYRPCHFLHRRCRYRDEGAAFPPRVTQGANVVSRVPAAEQSRSRPVRGAAILSWWRHGRLCVWGWTLMRWRRIRCHWQLSCLGNW